jgi:hypothetical protein
MLRDIVDVRILLWAWYEISSWRAIASFNSSVRTALELLNSSFNQISEHGMLTCYLVVQRYSSTNSMERVSIRSPVRNTCDLSVFAGQ